MTWKTRDEMAHELNVSTRTITRMVDRGDLQRIWRHNTPYYSTHIENACAELPEQVCLIAHVDKRPIWDLVIEDMRARDELGRERYGRPLTVDNGRDALVDAYEEALDLAVYLRQALEERDYE